MRLLSLWSLVYDLKKRKIESSFDSRVMGRSSRTQVESLLETRVMGNSRNLSRDFA